MPRPTKNKNKPTAASKTHPDFAQLDALLGYHLRRAQGAVHRDFLRAVEGFDLTQKQTAILWLIQANPGISQVAVAAALGMDRATMMAVTDRLEERNLITRERSSIDRRRQELKLTQTGQSTLSKVKTRIARHERKVGALLTAGEMKALLVALKKLQQVE